MHSFNSLSAVDENKYLSSGHITMKQRRFNVMELNQRRIDAVSTLCYTAEYANNVDQGERAASSGSISLAVDFRLIYLHVFPTIGMSIFKDEIVHCRNSGMLE